ncbi:unnamed protein product [Caenorhabditis bovis]|uniref:Uncharacterized protein n=1 Tax=Caenorhabditis bovis TaxID=2654633 RepID=A0A8S1EA33_9PELO|nr:unnamed protein product [Caenorhabditis bovis]
MATKNVIEIEDAVEVGPPRKRVKFNHFAEEVLFVVVEGPRKGVKRTRVNGPEIRKVKVDVNESPAKRRRPKEVSQEEMLATFGTDAEPIEIDTTPHSYFCYRYCVAGCAHDCPCRKDQADGESGVGRDGAGDGWNGGAGVTVGGEGGGGGGVGEAEMERVCGGG